MILQKPYLDQHFLENKEILKEQITLAKLSKKDNVIEIGAGDGRLTKLIAPKVNSLTSFETDERFKPILEKIPKVKFIFDNAIKHSWKGNNKIVSNIPYHLSEQIIIKSIKEGIEELTLIVGENFKKNLEKKESNIALLTNLFYELSPIQKISKKEFSPPPRVNSWLIQLKRKPLSIIQKIYLKKGKIKNAILYSLVEEGKTKKQAREIISKLKIPSSVLEDSTKNIDAELLNNLNEKLD